MSDHTNSSPAPDEHSGVTPAGAPSVAVEDKTMTVVTYALFLGGFVSGGVSAIIGLILAYANRSTATPRAQSHYTFLIRTFWIGAAIMLAAGAMLFWGAILSVILIGIPVLILGKLVFGLSSIWYGLRCIVGLLKALQNEAYPTPQNYIL